MSEWTPERHEAAKARCDAASPGPWSNIYYEARCQMVSAVTQGRIRRRVANTSGNLDGEANATFIAEARTDLPDALAEIERLGNILDRVAMADDSPRTWSGYCRYCDTHMSERPDHREDCRWMATRNKSQP